MLTLFVVVGIKTLCSRFFEVYQNSLVLVKYRDFHKLYVDEKFDDAAKLLFNLIVNAKAPLE